MRVQRSVLMSVISVLAVLGTALTAPRLMQQEELEQRISGLEARVTVLEQEVATLKSSGTSASQDTELYTINGSLRLRQDRDEDVVFLESAGLCSGTRGFDDIQTGANVVILDGSGNTLATTHLELKEGFTATGVSSNICEFSFTVEVPRASFYTVKIGRRGAPTYSFQEMEQNDWKIDLSIGS